MVSRPTSNQQPFISTECVRDALNSLLYASPTKDDNALERLMLVEEKLGTPSAPQFENARLLTVQTLLVDAITEEFTRLRTIYELPIPNPNTPFPIEIQAIQQDGATGSSQLIAWSLLYYRYVRTDLDISQDKYAYYVGFETRTLRRYTKQSYKDLTQKLIIAEWKSRVRQRYLRLHNALPYARRVEVFGRDALFERMQYLWSSTTIKHVLISGAPGAGKTTFAQEFIRRQIEVSQEASLTANHPAPTPHTHTPPIEHIVWVTSPSSAEDILYQISESLSLNHPFSVSLRDYLLQYRVIIVLDDVLNIPALELESTLKALSSAEVIVTSVETISFKNPIPHLILRDLDLDAIKRIIRANAPNVSHQEIEDFAEYIRLQVRGNPQAVKLVLQSLLLTPTPHQPSNIASIDTLYERQFNRLPAELQSAWLAFALIPDSGLTQDDLKHIWDDISPVILRELLERHLVEIQSNERWVISMTARKFMAFAYINDPHAQTIIHQRLETIINLVSHVSRTPGAASCLNCVEHILYAQFPPLLPEVRQFWMSLLLNHTRHHTHLWQAILERDYRAQSLEIAYILEYGRLLRRVQQWEKAQLVFEDVILQTGQRGDFVMQAQGMVEMAILLRVRGAYDKALRLLEESERTATRYYASTLLEIIYLEKTQIALDQKDPQTAAYYLERLPESPRSMMQLAEFALLNNMLDIGIHAALSARRAYTTDRLKLSMVYVLLGRLHTATAEYDTAHHYLALAVTLLEQLNDTFALARAKANLALVFIYQDDKATALYLLQHAEKVQREINDHVGLAFTQHNLAWLRQ